MAVANDHGSLLKQPFYARQGALSKGLNLCYTTQEAIQHSHLLPLLQEGRAVIAILFGDETPVTLHLQRDPEVAKRRLLPGYKLTSLLAKRLTGC